MPRSRRFLSSERSSRGSYRECYRSRKHKRRRSRSRSSSSERWHHREDSYHVRSRSYDDHSSDRRAYDRRYLEDYRRDGYSDRGGDASEYHPPEVPALGGSYGPREQRKAAAGGAGRSFSRSSSVSNPCLFRSFDPGRVRISWASPDLWNCTRNGILDS
ncbi:hypothetical protein E2320_013938 [Naja naja]|uniref:Uncharacterized protein n=1 Tax=Naja naja TaxID=35670 RepID=A0A8C6VN46_NAJNA|nr:hypothetical protein E2320_013938 [Naja naja]